MSELTKSLEIIAKHLSNAFLSMAADFRKLNEPASPLSQACENPKLVSLNAPELTKRDNYKIGDLVMVMLDGGVLPTKMKVSEVLQGMMYLAYFPRELKSSVREIRHDQILGLDPNR
jgi:uncharacterized protein YlaN (UPF0358 family)